MVKLHKLHKFAGISAGVVLLLLSISGFFLDHEKWSFLYTTTFKHLPQATIDSDKRLFNAYYIDKKDPNHIIVGSYRGIYESIDAGKSFSKTLNLQCLSIKSDGNSVYAATSDGVYKLLFGTWVCIVLKDKDVTSFALSKHYILAVVDKKDIYKIDKKSLKTLTTTDVEIPKEKLQEDIKLSRFVRDLHYGQGLFDGDVSLLINDYGAIVLTFLALSGYLIWWFIYKKTYAKVARKFIKLHSNILSILATIPLLILAITGIFLDHSSALAGFMKSVTIPHAILPPIYNSLKSDIWSCDYDDGVYRIGNRYGIYKSENLKSWELENRGLAYKMIRKGKSLYVSGMGAPNRLFLGEWKILKDTPHMFKDVTIEDTKARYFSTRSSEYKLPHFKDVTLYSLLLTIHDGSFFSDWWVWVNDYVSLALFILCVTGTLRWYKKRRRKSSFSY